MTETRSLHRKLAQIMYEAERIPKNGTAPAAMGGFKFVQVGDAADFIRKALADHIISMVPTAVEVVGQSEHAAGADGKKTMTTLDLRVTWTLTDGETGETTTIVSYGAGADMGDKYSGKAQTNAMKYALLMGFLLSTGDDPELADTSDRQHRRTPPSAAPKVDGLIGTAERQASVTTDFELRESPDGAFLGFRLKNGSPSGVIVQAVGQIAFDIADHRSQIEGQRVQAWGDFVTVPIRGKPGASYNAYRITRLVCGDLDLPETKDAPSMELGLGVEAEAELEAIAEALT